MNPATLICLLWNCAAYSDAAFDVCVCVFCLKYHYETYIVCIFRWHNPKVVSHIRRENSTYSEIRARGVARRLTVRRPHVKC